MHACLRIKFYIIFVIKRSSVLKLEYAGVEKKT
jgi:hypothetical protein